MQSLPLFDKKFASKINFNFVEIKIYISNKLKQLINIFINEISKILFYWIYLINNILIFLMCLINKNILILE
jgi:hypothetical protein